MATANKSLLNTIDPFISGVIEEFAGDTRRLLKDNIIVEYLFGSYTTQTETYQSDIDI